MNKDKLIICEDCKQEFVFTAGEQEFYTSKGLAEPKYCLICRGKYEAAEEQMRKFGRKVEDLEKMKN